MIVCGIDYSMTSPAIAVHVGDEWSINNCKFYYMSPKAKQIVNTKQFDGTLYPKFGSDPERYDNLARWSLGIIESSSVDVAFMEGYSFGSVGRVFQIAENAGLVKYMMWKNSTPCTVFAPTEIKKHATGKGNANKEALYEAFLEETSVDIRQAIGITSVKDWNPLSDIVDSYYIAKLGFMRENDNANHT